MALSFFSSLLLRRLKAAYLVGVIHLAAMSALSRAQRNATKLEETLAVTGSYRKSRCRQHSSVRA